MRPNVKPHDLPTPVENPYEGRTKLWIAGPADDADAGPAISSSSPKPIFCAWGAEMRMNATGILLEALWAPASPLACRIKSFLPHRVTGDLRRNLRTNILENGLHDVAQARRACCQIMNSTLVRDVGPIGNLAISRIKKDRLPDFAKPARFQTH
jgi:hypothetical protein